MGLPITEDVWLGSLPHIHECWQRHPRFGSRWEEANISLVARAFFRWRGEVGGWTVEGSDVDDGQVVMCAEGLPDVTYCNTFKIIINHTYNLHPDQRVFRRTFQKLFEECRNTTGNICVVCFQGAHRSSDAPRP